MDFKPLILYFHCCTRLRSRAVRTKKPIDWMPDNQINTSLSDLISTWVYRPFLLLIAACCCLSSCNRKVFEKGKASYYADVYKGRKTANGETFSQRKRTAAHPSLPFGTRVKVTNLKNGKTVKVRINDRGPFVAGRIIDLSRKAARRLDMTRDGVVEVQLRYRKQRK